MIYLLNNDSEGLAVLDQLKLALNFGLFSLIQLLMNSRSIIGVNLLHIVGAGPEVILRTIKADVALWKQGEIGAVFNSNELSEAHCLVEARKSIGKVCGIEIIQVRCLTTCTFKIQQTFYI
jgi:hypothetical protein